MLSKIEHSVDQYIRIRKNIERCLDDAGRAERYLSKPNNRNVPSMYQLIETSYLATEHGYYDKVKLKLRATPRQMQNYDTAIDILLMVDDKLCDDPLLIRKILWLKATRNSFTSIGKYLVYHRTTIKRMYDNILDKLTNKIIKESLDIYDRKFS
ncbi:hypothetical protein HTVC028P_gp02 [Pelagibacter phage HTVC028P]|nr:hypothetical protein HTVC028P_gp02 [Pelagibacter phage HTVC028P]|tara:strand:- start:273 stop:734 length:462 start_codon:yes stop_codon:yes gene_type:complete